MHRTQFNFWFNMKLSVVFSLTFCINFGALRVYGVSQCYLCSQQDCSKSIIHNCVPVLEDTSCFTISVEQDGMIKVKSQGCISHELAKNLLGQPGVTICSTDLCNFLGNTDTPANDTTSNETTPSGVYPTSSGTTPSDTMSNSTRPQETSDSTPPGTTQNDTTPVDGTTPTTTTSKVTSPNKITTSEATSKDSTLDSTVPSLTSNDTISNTITSNATSDSLLENDTSRDTTSDDTTKRTTIAPSQLGGHSSSARYLTSIFLTATTLIFVNKILVFS